MYAFSELIQTCVQQQNNNNNVLASVSPLLPVNAEPLKWSDCWLYISRDTDILKLIIFIFMFFRLLFRLKKKKIPKPILIVLTASPVTHIMKF